MINCEHLKPVALFHCDVPGLDTDKIYSVNGVGALQYAGQKGLQLHFEAGRPSEKPLQLINLREDNGLSDVHQENTITVAAGASANLIVCDHTTSDHHFVTNTLNCISLEEGAHLELLMMQNEHNRSAHTTTVKVQQAAHSFFSCTVITLHGGAIENNFDVALQGEKAECVLNGLFLCDGTQRVTNTVQMRHAAPACKSRQLFKGLLSEQAIGRFHGHIIVDAVAQKTEALQENHNILLTHAAKMYIQPHLEIYADDVKCAHGATIGRIDENALFYLRSRGIGLTEARFLQQFAFAHNIIEHLTLPPLRERIADLVSQRLRGELHPCTGCARHCC